MNKINILKKKNHNNRQLDIFVCDRLMQKSESRAVSWKHKETIVVVAVGKTRNGDLFKKVTKKREEAGVVPM